MLLDLHHDFAGARGDFVRKAGAIVMPKNTQPNITAAAEKLLASAGKSVPAEIIGMSDQDFEKVLVAADDVAHQNAMRRMGKLSLSDLGME
jgi:hypothetical protein